MVELSEAYVLGLLTDIEASVPQLLTQLTQAKKRAAAVDAELSNLLRRLDDSQNALRQAQAQLQRASASVNDGNSQIATLHSEIAMLQKKGEDIKLEMERVRDEPALRRKLRRERAKVRVQVEDKETEIEEIKKRVEGDRASLGKADEIRNTERDRSRVLTAELDKLQSQLPSPYLYTKLAETLAARAHCNMYLDHDAVTWAKELREAIAWATELHRELRAGKYRLDRNSDLVGGRAMATAEAIYGALAIGEPDLCKELFELATDPSLFFHQIFNVFRVWCLGLYLTGQTRKLGELLRLHQFAEGLRGGYVNAFIGLLQKDKRRLAVGLKDITRHEWEIWQDPNLVRGAGVVNVGAVALGRLALDAGIAVQMPGPTVPTELLAPPRRRDKIGA